MTRTNLSMSISADGYVAGPNQSEDHPLGVGGRALHEWHLGPTKDHPANLQVISDMMDGIGATIQSASHAHYDCWLCPPPPTRQATRHLSSLVAASLAPRPPEVHRSRRSRCD